MSGSIRMVSLRRADSGQPWGFRMRGGAEQGIPLFVEQVSPHGLAAVAGLTAGDVILQIGGTDVRRSSHNQVKQEILRAGNELDFIVQKGGVSGEYISETTSHREPRVEVVEEHIGKLGGPTYKQVTPKTYQVLEQELEPSEEGYIAPRPVASTAAKPSSIFDRQKQERSAYLKAQGSTIQKAFGQTK